MHPGALAAGILPQYNNTTLLVKMQWFWTLKQGFRLVIALLQRVRKEEEQIVKSCGAANATFFIGWRQHKIQFPISANFLRDREHSSYQID